MKGYIQKSDDLPWVPYLVPEGRDAEGSPIPWLGGEGLLRSMDPEIAGLSEQGMMDLLKTTHATVWRFELVDGEGKPCIMLAIPDGSIVASGPPAECEVCDGEPQPLPFWRSDEFNRGCAQEAGVFLLRLAVACYGVYGLARLFG